MPIERRFAVNSRIVGRASECVPMLQIRLSGTGAAVLIGSDASKIGAAAPD